jgi:hypothetical protein
MKPYLNDFRTAITFLNAYNQRIVAYKMVCLSQGVCPRKFGVDMNVRWNSTYLMLKHVIPYKSTFSIFIQSNHPLSSDGSPLLTDDHWYIADKVLSFLELFYDSIVAMSGIYYPTSPLMLHHILKIGRHLNAFESDHLLREAIIPMKTKYLKYWRKIPILYAFAFILDPRAKMRGFHKLLLRLASLTGTDYSRFPQSIRAKLTKTFQLYECKYGDTLLRGQYVLASGSESKAKEAWDDIYGDDDIVGGQHVLGSSSTPIASIAASISVLPSYLDSDSVTQFGAGFNILNWWQRHKLTYPILALLAKDVLTVPASTISSESTFSLAGRVLEEHRRRLTTDMVEALSCIKDWELADKHMQNTVENDTKELEATYENMYLDVEDRDKDKDGESRPGRS